MTNILHYVAVVVLIAVSAFFSGTEIAYSSVNIVRLKNRAKDSGSFALKTAIKVHESYEKLLSTILIGNNIANMASSSIATLIVISWWGNDYVWASTVIMTILV